MTTAELVTALRSSRTDLRRIVEVAHRKSFPFSSFRPEA